MVVIGTRLTIVILIKNTTDKNSALGTRITKKTDNLKTLSYRAPIEYCLPSLIGIRSLVLRNRDE